MAFVRVGDVSEVLVGKMKGFSAEGKEILVANVEGRYYAMGRLCTHAKGNLAEGSLEDGIVTCPRHGSKFDVRTGKLVTGPKVLFMKLKAPDATSYSTKVEGTAIMVDVH